MDITKVLQPPETEQPLPEYKKIIGENYFIKVKNALSLSRKIIEERHEDSPEYTWAKMIINIFDN